MEKTLSYIRVYNILKREIIDGTFSIGDLLPPEPHLEKRFNVSRTTVRRAIELLKRDGLITVKQGFGTAVIDFRTRQNLNLVTSISETLQKKGHEVATKSMYIDFTEAGTSLAEDFSIKPGERLVRIQRIQLSDNSPIAIMKNYLLPAMVPEIEKYTNTFHSLYTFLEDHYNISIDSATERISARSANFEEAEMLHVSVGCALLYTHRVCFSNNKPVCSDFISLVGDRYEMEINMVGRAK